MAPVSRRVYFFFVLDVLVWGYNWVPLHLLLAHVGPATLAGVRVAGGAAVLFIALLAMRKPIAPPRGRAFIAIGLMQVSGMTGLSTLALLFGDVSRTTILVFTMPFWATLLSRVVLGERVGHRRWAALAIALIGLAFVASHAAGNPRTLLGAAIAVAAGACWAGGSVVAKKYRRESDDLLAGVAWQQLVGALPLIAIALVVREPAPIFTPNVIVLFVFVAAFGSGLGWLLWAAVLAKLPAGSVALGSLGIPVVAALSAFAQLGERPDSVTLTGLVLILAAIVVATWPTRVRRIANDASQTGEIARAR